ncbi:unnamed protein product [Microthlaspi erraticum]|uniref:Endonuclease/exonuclease/phosphatase domain-containing protein n=1 Tax=Microthlaspi erraticum TaxID=1685480 RepID=A0A6D2JLH1_9BRAS|nr:unnamed protein product [Microthlaspi erraticum]
MKIVSPQGLSGGLVVLWKDYVLVSCISVDVRLVDLHVEYKSFQFYLSCVYGNPMPSLRHCLWEKLQRIATSRQGAWMMCEDFNEIVSNAEKWGGRLRAQSSFRDFKQIMNICDMKDIQHKETEFLDMAESDHRPMIVTIAYEERRRRYQFRYDKRLTDHDDFVNTVKHHWVNCLSHIDDLSTKLGLSRKEMSKWKRRNRFNAAEEIQIIRSKLDKALRDHQVLNTEIKKLRSDLNRAYYNEEVYWNLKSRTHWLQAGDRNTAYFHGATKARRRKTCIK